NGTRLICCLLHLLACAYRAYPSCAFVLLAPVTSILTKKELDLFCATYNILANLKPKFPGCDDTIKNRPKAEAIQADCDVKATNIILQPLPPEIYALVSMHKVAKDLWERIQMLMQGTSLTKQERECKLYDAFDKFAYQKGETLRDFYLRFSLLLNVMNMYNMKLEQF
nr:hypothetical protein [Tanacetum cinerariifolium]